MPLSRSLTVILDRSATVALLLVGFGGWLEVTAFRQPPLVWRTLPASVLITGQCVVVGHVKSMLWASGPECERQHKNITKT